MRWWTWRAAVAWLLCSTMCLLACAPTRPVPVVPPPAPACPSPERPELLPLDPSEHLGSAHNLELLMDNVIGLASYVERLEAAVKCWKAREAGKEARP